MCDCDDCECCECCKDIPAWQIVGLIVLGIIVFVSCFLIGFSVTIMHPLYFGLEYDENARSVDSSKLVPSGRHFTGLGFSYLQFPRIQQLIIFSNSIRWENENKPGAGFHEDAAFYDSMRTRTKEGMAIDVDVFLSYKFTTSSDGQVQSRQLWDIYQKFGTDVNAFIVILVLSEVRNVFTNFLANQIPQSRQDISTSITAQIEAQLTKYHLSLITANIINIEFPTALDNAYTDTQIAKEEEKKMDFTLQTAQVEAQTAINLAQIEQRIILSKSKTLADQEFFKYQVQASSTQQSIEFQKAAVQNVQNSLFPSVGTPTNSRARRVLAFLWIYALRQNTASNVVFATDFPQKLNN